MDLNTIESIADKCGLKLGMYGPMKLVDHGEFSRFEKSTELTMYGENLVLFANAIENHITNKSTRPENPGA